VNSWTALLLAADLVGFAVAVARAVWPPPADAGGAALRRVRLAEAGLVASLVALVAWQAVPLGFGGVIGLVAMAFVAGESLRWMLALEELAGRLGGGPGSSTIGAVTAILALTIVAVVGLSAAFSHPAQPAVTETDSARFGVAIFDHEPSVTALTRPGRPTLADADVAGGVAAPVERYSLDGGLLTLVVRHDLTCRVAVVLLGPDGGATDAVVDVVVVYAPRPRTPSGAPAGSTQPGGCEAAGALTVRGALDVVIPAELHVGAVRDVGAGGAAKLVR
jgi:hypothetical protein